jgi:hypothetical protein
VGKAVDLTYCDNVVLDIQASASPTPPATRVSTTNCTNVLDQAATASTSRAGLLPALGGGTTNFLRADGTWAAPSGGAGSSLYRVDRPNSNKALSAGTATYINWNTSAALDEIGGGIGPHTASPYEAFTIPANGYYRLEAYIGAFDTNRLFAEWWLTAGAVAISSATFTSNPSGENWCSGIISTGWRYFLAGTVVKLRVTSEDAADVYGNEAAGWATVEKRG